MSDATPESKSDSDPIDGEPTTLENVNAIADVCGKANTNNSENANVSHSANNSHSDDNSHIADGSQNPPNKLNGTQFGIGQLMAITVGVSIVCAVLATVLRRLPEEQQTKGSLFILVMVLVCLIALVFFYLRRARVEKQAGRSHFITKAPLSSWFHVTGIASCVATLVAMVVGLVSVSGNEDVAAVVPIWQYAYMIWMLGAFTGNYLISVFLWKTHPKSVDVRTNGLILGPFMFIPWKHFHGFRWNRYTEDLMLLSDANFLEWKVPKNQREQLEEALAEFIPKKEGFS